MNKAETYIYISVYSEELGWTGHVSAKCISSSSSSGGRGQTKAGENLWQKLDQHILSTRLTTGVLTTSVLPVLSDVSCCLAGGERRHFLNFRSYRDLEQLFWPCGMSSQAGKFLELLQTKGVWEEEKLDLSCPLIEVGAHVSSQQLKAQWVQGERGPFKDQELRASTCRANYSVPKYQSLTQVPSTTAVPVPAKRLCTKVPCRTVPK